MTDGEPDFRDELIWREPDAEQGDEEYKFAMLKELRRIAAASKKLADELSVQLLPVLRADPSRYFIGADGAKYLAYYSQPKPLDVDLEQLVAMVDAGELGADVLEEVAPRKVKIEDFKRANAAGRIPDHIFVKVAAEGSGSPSVRFDSP